MFKNDKAGDSNKPSGALDRFEPGREFGPIDDRSENEQRLKSLPPEESELAQESTRLADLSQYFSVQRMDIPPEILDQLTALRGLEISERIRALKQINEKLMEYLNNVGEDFGIQH